MDKEELRKLIVETGSVNLNPKLVEALWELYEMKYCKQQMTLTASGQDYQKLNKGFWPTATLEGKQNIGTDVYYSTGGNNRT